MLSEAEVILTRSSWRQQFQASRAPRQTGWRNAFARLAMRVATASTVSPAFIESLALVVHMADACPALAMDTQTPAILRQVNAGADTTLLVSIVMSVQLDIMAMLRLEAQMPALLVRVLQLAVDQVPAIQCQGEQRRARPRSAPSALRVAWELVVSCVARAPGAIPRQTLLNLANHASAVATLTSADQAVAIAAPGSA